MAVTTSALLGTKSLTWWTLESKHMFDLEDSQVSDSKGPTKLGDGKLRSPQNRLIDKAPRYSVLEPDIGYAELYQEKAEAEPYRAETRPGKLRSQGTLRE